MKSRIAVTVCAAIALTVCLAGTAFAANSVTIESKTVLPNATGVEVGVFLVNDFDLYSLVVPLEVREVDAGAYITNSFSFDVQGRVAASGLQDFKTGPFTYPTPSGDCSGPTSSSYNPFAPAAPDFVSPDGMFYAGVVIASAPLGVGSDDATPSFLLTFDVTAGPGVFEIDTCCTTPANHISYADQTATQEIVPDFTKGVITIGPSAVQEVGGAVPHTFRVDQNYPNPFNAGTVIPFGVAYDSHVRIDIYDILGRCIATVADDDYTAGNYNADWDGRDKNGSAVATGVYFYRFVSDQMTETRKMVVLK